MGLLFGVLVFVVILRLLLSGGTPPLWACGLALVLSLVLTSVATDLLASFLTAIGNSVWIFLPLLLLVLAICSVGGYYYGRMKGAEPADPFNPFS